MKDKKYYLGLTPQYLDKERWIREVNFVFDIKQGGPEWIEYLEKFYNSKPRTINERWTKEAELYE